MSADVDKLPRDYRKTLRIALVLIGVFGPPVAYVAALERKVDRHLAEVDALRPQMDAYVREERSARCATARNVYRLCLRLAEEKCEQVSASCEGGR